MSGEHKTVRVYYISLLGFNHFKISSSQRFLVCSGYIELLYVETVKFQHPFYPFRFKCDVAIKVSPYKRNEKGKYIARPLFGRDFSYLSITTIVFKKRKYFHWHIPRMSKNVHTIYCIKCHHILEHLKVKKPGIAAYHSIKAHLVMSCKYECQLYYAL